MRFAEYFEKAAEYSKTDPEKAQALVREAEKNSLAAVPEHLILCARVWMEYLQNRDQALRCLYWDECRSGDGDARVFCDLAEAYIVLVHDVDSAVRCLKKASALMDRNDFCDFRKELQKKIPHDRKALILGCNMPLSKES